MSAVNLPPMIQPAWRENRPTNPPKPGAEWYSREHMVAYAEAAVLIEREAAAKRCEAEHLVDPTREADDIAYDIAVNDCAKAVRRGDS